MWPPIAHADARKNKGGTLDNKRPARQQASKLVACVEAAGCKQHAEQCVGRAGAHWPKRVATPLTHLSDVRRGKGRLPPTPGRNANKLGASPRSRATHDASRVGVEAGTTCAALLAALPRPLPRPTRAALPAGPHQRLLHVCVCLSARRVPPGAARLTPLPTTLPACRRPPVLSPMRQPSARPP